MAIGTCRVLQLFDPKSNDTQLTSIHYTNYANIGGKNFIGWTNTPAQAEYLIRSIMNPTYSVTRENMPYLKHLYGILSQPELLHDYVKGTGIAYDINSNLAQLRAELMDVSCFVIEICSLKKIYFKHNKIPILYDLYRIRPELHCETYENMNYNQLKQEVINLIEFLQREFPYKGIILVGHIVKSNKNPESFDETIPDRKLILEVLEEVCQKYTKCRYLNPNDHITNDDLEDNRHYRLSGRIKIIHALQELVNHLGS